MVLVSRGHVETSVWFVHFATLCSSLDEHRIIVSPPRLSRMALRATKIHENPGLWRTTGEHELGFRPCRRPSFKYCPSG
jgi:hypothetical protein